MITYKVLSTKKLASSLIQKAHEEGMLIEEKEFISIRPIINDETIEAVSHLISSQNIYAVFTSANSVHVLNDILEKLGENISLKIFCIDGNTKEVLINSKNIQCEIIADASYAKDLTPKIIEHAPASVHFFCGNLRRDWIPHTLKYAGIKVHEYILYETILQPVEVSKNYDAIFFYSPSAVESYFSKNSLNTATTIFTIGETTASSLPENLGNTIIVSASPRQENMVKMAIEHFKTRQVKP